MSRQQASGERPAESVDMVKRRPSGNSSAYLRARLRRDHPEIAEALDRGEYPSVRAAAVAAGIVKQPAVLARLKREWGQAGLGDRDAFLQHVERTRNAISPWDFRQLPPGEQRRVMEGAGAVALAQQAIIEQRDKLELLIKRGRKLQRLARSLGDGADGSAALLDPFLGAVERLGNPG